MESLKQKLSIIRKEHIKRKLDRIDRNLFYINKKRINKKFKAGDLILYQNVRLQGQKASRCIYTPGIILEINKSGNSANIQSLITKRIIKYNFSFIKKITKPLFYKLPPTWKKLILESVRRPEEIPSQDTNEENMLEDVFTDEEISEDEDGQNSQASSQL